VLGMAGVHFVGSGRQPDETGRAGQVHSDGAVQQPAATTPPERGRSRTEFRGQGTHGPRTSGPAPRTDNLQQLPSPHRSVRPRPGKLQRHRPLARSSRRGKAAGRTGETSARRSMPPARCPRARIQHLCGIQTRSAGAAGPFVRALAEKLLIYAIGRTLEPADRATIDKVVTASQSPQPTLRSLLKQIVAYRGVFSPSDVGQASLDVLWRKMVVFVKNLFRRPASSKKIHNEFDGNASPLDDGLCRQGSLD